MSETLYLFSSNIRSRYAQDVIDLLGYPRDGIYHFRYEETYVDFELREAWRQNGLVDCQVVVIFSIQEPNRFHDAAFIPVRQGLVLRTTAEGAIYAIDFTLGDIVALEHAAEEQSRESQRIAVRGFSTTLRNATLIGRTPDVVSGDPYSAVAGTWPPHPTAGNDWRMALGDEHHNWQTTVSLLGGTLAFSDRVFMRFVALLDPDGVPASRNVGSFKLIAGHTYELMLSHFSSRDHAEGTAYVISTDDDLVQPIGSRELLITSRYDTISVPIHVSHVREARDTVLIVEPREGTFGARIQIDCHLVPDTTRAVVGGVGTAIALFLIAVPALLGDDASQSLRIALAGAGVTLGTFLAAFGLRTG